MEEIIFVAQKIIMRLLFPVFISLGLGIAGIVLWKRRGLALFLVSAGVLWLAVTSFPITGLLLIRSLESKAGPYADPAKLSALGVRYVVVLSGGFRRGDLTPTDRVADSLQRLCEGIRLQRGIPGCTLVLTGGAIPGLSDEMSIARALADVAEQMGVPKESMILETHSWTTAGQAKLVAPVVGNAPFALVTSAFHMPRSLMLFRFKGMDPAPAPADFITREIALNYDTLIPQAQGISFSQTAVKEYIATWAQMALHRLRPEYGAPR